VVHRVPGGPVLLPPAGRGEVGSDDGAHRLAELRGLTRAPTLVQNRRLPKRERTNRR
jgi:hypothetical protein